MEDISRELEREIAQTKPKPYKQDRKTHILIVDDFGKMKSGEHLKRLLMGLSIGCGVCFVLAILFLSLYSGLSSSSKKVKTRLEVVEKKLDELNREKEVLMARLVIQGKEPGIIDGKTQNTEPPIVSKTVKKQSLVSKKQKSKSAPVVTPTKKTIKPQTTMGGQPTKKSSGIPDVARAKKMVSIEKFTVVRDGNNGDLLVRFDIRNVSLSPGDVSGRIFTVLKPDNKDGAKWLVVPSASLKDGVPSEYRKGQYFSIAHFKPVKFRIKNKANPNLFKKASIFIFNNQGELMFNELIDITEANE